MTRWVVFDYGEVISLRTAALPSIAGVLGAPVREFEEAYWAERTAYDRGRTDLEYWMSIGNRLGVRVDAALAPRLTAMDNDGWLETSPETVKLIEDLAGADVRLALLSNAPASFGRAVEQQPWTERFDHLLFSGDLGVVKPEALIWQILLAGLGTTPDRCVYFDDRADNVEAGLQAGLHAHHWAGAEAARDVLHTHEVL
ncbi:HAD family hydrolase [Saccharopolyspora cebuensis]|uniref:HAD family hydrolase n=1 Tax=Saccharopolyspora cebuensis TaxID=418759 RepID=A0ABV4CQM7_9PSEU